MYIDRVRWHGPLSTIQAVVKVLHTMDARLGQMEAVLARLDERTQNMSKEMDALRAAVERMESAGKSMEVLLNGIAQLIRDNAANPAVLQLLADQINKDADSFVAAVQANTDVDQRPSPATQPPEPPPPSEPPAGPVAIPPPEG